MNRRRAGVVILGSNSTRMLTADLGDTLQNPVRGRVETGLYRALGADGLFKADALQRAAQSACTLVQQARMNGAEHVFCLATSAARDAHNTSELAAAIRAGCGVEMWVLSGQMEALFSYLGAASTMDHARPVGVIDIGGGSTEVAWGEGDQLVASVSFQMGASRLHLLKPIDNPGDIPPALDLAKAAMQGFDPHTPLPEDWLLVGGTGAALKDIALGLPAASPAPEQYTFERQQVAEQLARFAALSPAGRAAVPGLPAGREHIYPTGLAILQAVMDLLHIRQATVTLRNNTDGFLTWYTEAYRQPPHDITA